MRCVIAVLLLCTLVATCTPKAPPEKEEVISRTWPLIGAPFGVQIYGAETAVAEEAIAAARAEVDRVVALVNPHSPQSDLSRINAAAGKEPVAISREVFAVLQLAQQVAEASGGAFDVTFASASHLWNLKNPEAALPTEADIAAALKLVGYRHLHLDVATRTAFLDQTGMSVGLGAIAPGWLADILAQVMRTHGVANAIVDASGDMIAIGSHLGKPFRIGIRHPRRLAGENYAVLRVMGDLAVATSGDYERFVMRGGVRYHHIIDPRVGRPAPLCQSVTILGPHAALADALATAVFVLGPQEGLAMLAEKYPAYAALIIDTAGREHMSTNFAQRVQIKRMEN